MHDFVFFLPVVRIEATRPTGFTSVVPRTHSPKQTRNKIIYRIELKYNHTSPPEKVESVRKWAAAAAAAVATTIIVVVIYLKGEEPYKTIAVGGREQLHVCVSMYSWCVFVCVCANKHGKDSRTTEAPSSLSSSSFLQKLCNCWTSQFFCSQFGPSVVEGAAANTITTTGAIF